MTKVCQHHWLLPDTEEPKVKGVCRKCGVERIFRNHLVVDKPSAWPGIRVEATEKRG